MTAAHIDHEFLLHQFKERSAQFFQHHDFQYVHSTAQLIHEHLR